MTDDLFPIGARVTIGRYYPHFPQNVGATVLYSYALKYPEYAKPGDEHLYGLDVDGRGESAWYPRDVLCVEGATPPNSSMYDAAWEQSRKFSEAIEAEMFKVISGRD